MTRQQAWELLRRYNAEPFHLRHALTVEGVMRCFAEQRGYDPEFWGIVGLLHDIDFEQWPEQHCVKAPELLREGGAEESIIHAVCSHGWAICVDIKPEHEMEKLLYAADALTGLIGAAALMRPSKSVQDMELKSLKKKYKDKKFAAGCSREVIERGAELFFSFAHIFFHGPKAIDLFGNQRLLRLQKVQRGICAVCLQIIPNL